MSTTPSPGETAVFGPAHDVPAVHPVALRGTAWTQDAPPPRVTTPQRLRTYAARLADHPRLAAARRRLGVGGWRSPGALLAAAALVGTGFLGGSLLGHDDHGGIGGVGANSPMWDHHGRGMDRDGH